MPPGCETPEQVKQLHPTFDKGDFFYNGYTVSLLPPFLTRGRAELRICQRVAVPPAQLWQAAISTACVRFGTCSH